MPTHPQSRSKAAETVQRQLARYRAMRDFHITPEPSGKNGKASGRSIATLPFVIQKHAATRLHYDFRLGWHGVLKSWAVTKGPSYNPADKRLAVQVEDHPMEYGGFEGTIPKGQYGGGTVMVWDFGEWTPLDDVDSGLAKGHLKFELHGKKLQGRWALVRMHGRGERPVKNRKTGVKEDFLTLHTAEGLVGMAQMGVLEIHPWGSRNETLEQPDRIVFDLDPDAAIDWATLAAAAADLRKRLSKLHLTTFLKSTGGKGLHVVVPIEPEHEWPVIKRFAHEIVLKMEAEQPDLYITKMTKAERKNRIYLDYLRNDREATSVAPFSPRARSGAPVSITLGWNELKTDAAPVFQVANFAQWRSRLNRDPWKEMVGIRQRLTEAMLNEVSAMGSSRSRKR
ncbi:MAG TPA: DNA polymerase ligase N-terminal domain-containing protein [Terracidiphilus sp.]|nr:DNA polymerase ligase N-terminal domain-containing protein [Terracidiphilus sp.]